MWWRPVHYHTNLCHNNAHRDLPLPPGQSNQFSPTRRHTAMDCGKLMMRKGRDVISKNAFAGAFISSFVSVRNQGREFVFLVLPLFSLALVIGLYLYSTGSGGERFCFKRHFFRLGCGINKKFVIFTIRPKILSFHSTNCQS